MFSSRCYLCSKTPVSVYTRSDTTRCIDNPRACRKPESISLWGRLAFEQKQCSHNPTVFTSYRITTFDSVFVQAVSGRQ